MNAHGSYLAKEDLYGGASINCINPPEQPGIGEYYTVRVAVISHSKGTPCEAWRRDALTIQREDTAK